MVGTELTKMEVTRMTKLLKENKAEFASSLADIPGFDPSMVIHKLNLDLNVKKNSTKEKNVCPRKGRRPLPKRWRS